MRRRSLLSCFLAVVAGCAGSPRSTPVPSPTATDRTTEGRTTSSEPTPTDEPLPAISKPGDDCTVVDRPTGDYPALPASLTEAGASEFARNHEKVYAEGELAAESGTEFQGFDGEETEVKRTTKTGVLVFVRLALDFTKDDGDRTITGSESAQAWYYVTESFVVRAEGEQDSVPKYGWDTVACADE